MKSLLYKAMRWQNTHISFPQRRRALTHRLSPYLVDSHKVLDLGSSDGALASELMKACPQIAVTGVDVHPLPNAVIPIIKYDGKRLPFEDNSFDTVMLIDVLHHDEHIEQVLGEAKRVSSDKILIKDHYWSTKLDILLLRWADYSGNRPYDIPLPYNYLTIPGWEKVFDELGLGVVKSEKFQFVNNWFDICKHVTYLLKK